MCDGCDRSSPALQPRWFFVVVVFFLVIVSRSTASMVFCVIDRLQLHSLDGFL